MLSTAVFEKLALKRSVFIIIYYNICCNKKKIIKKEVLVDIVHKAYDRYLLSLQGTLNTYHWFYYIIGTIYYHGNMVYSDCREGLQTSVGYN